jgi:hypothetical protein
LFNTDAGGSQQGPILTNAATAIANGLFTSLLDFGPGILNGSNSWLEIAVRTNGGGAFTTLSPRQFITPAPYAIMAGSASNLVGALPVAQLTGSLPSANLSGTYSNSLSLTNPANSFAGNGAGLTNLNAASLGGSPPSSFWQLDGNSGAGTGRFLGTTNNYDLEFRVNSGRALKLSMNSPAYGGPNIVGGAAVNGASDYLLGITIAGGGASGYYADPGPNIVLSDFGTIGGGYSNTIGQSSSSVDTRFATIAGGFQNAIQEADFFSVISGGSQNLIGFDAYASVIAGGAQNTIQSGAFNSFIGGGFPNMIRSNASYSVISGGYFNTNGGHYSTVPGGYYNSALGDFSFAAGHQAKANHPGTFIWSDSQSADFASTGTNQFLIRASGGVGIGTTAPEAPLHVVESSAGAVTANPASIAVFERSGNSYLSMLTPSNNESGLIFGSPINSTDGGIVFNNSLTSRGLQFRTAANSTRMVILSNGDVGIGTNSPQQRLHVLGNILATGTVNGSSDRNLKEHFEPVDTCEVLDKVAALPITRWNYKAETNVSHLGPMAQDFYSAFNVGMDDKHISMVDADGVAMAAIQGLNKKLEQLRSSKDACIAELEERLVRLEEMVSRNALAQKTGAE